MSIHRILLPSSLVAAPCGSYRHAIAVQEKTIRNHSELARTIDNYALLLRKSKRDSKAEAAADRARQIRQSFGPSNP